MKLLIASLFVILLTGCAAPTYKHEVAGLNRSESIKVVDLRPKSESEQEVFSALITSDAYATYRWSSQTLDPSAVRLFQHKIYEKFTASETPVEVKIYHFVSYLNAQSAYRRTAIGSVIGGAIGAAVASGTQNYEADFKATPIDRIEFESLANGKEYERTFFNEADNPGKSPIFLIYIDAEINGKRNIIRGISPAARSDKQDPHLYAVENTIKSFLTYY